MTARAPRELSKSKLLAFRQCPKRLWLEVHRPQLREDSRSTQATFKTGHEVGELAQRLYDPSSHGVLVDLHAEGVWPAVQHSKNLLQGTVPVFEAGFAAGGAMAFADVMLPVMQDGKAAWRMVEVKSSTSVKDYYLDDIAIQSFVARESGILLSGVALAHIDSQWTYRGDGNYHGLLIEVDLTESAFHRSDEVRQWIAAAHDVVALKDPPDLATGFQCSSPFVCGFAAHCKAGEVRDEFPVAWLPRIQSPQLKKQIQQRAIRDMRDVPSDLLSPLQRRVRDCTVSDKCYFDADGASRDLRPHQPPAYFLDFETIQFGVPRWPGTRSFQSVPFQFSLHFINSQGELSHDGFLDLSGADPTLGFARSLVEHCGKSGPIFVYNAGFEGSRIQELATRFPDLRTSLLGIRKRLVDLLPVAQARFYHPSQMGSWSIKRVLPAMAPQLRYDQITGVQDGELAMLAYLEAIEPTTAPERKLEIEEQLQRYCALDTLAMVEIWKFLSGGKPIATSESRRISQTEREDQMITSLDQKPDLADDTSFFSALMAEIMNGTMIPKVQTERAVGPLIGYFLADVLSKHLKQQIVMLCPEFPIKKAPLGRAAQDPGNTSLQSTNIDWLMFNKESKQLVLVELKTTDTTFRPSQAVIYKDLQRAIKELQSAELLYTSIEEISQGSKEKGKYRHVLCMLKDRVPGGLNQLKECKEAQVIYIAPESSKPDNWTEMYSGWTWLSFSDLPTTITHRHAQQWSVLRESLLQLDDLNLAKRNRLAT